MSSIEEEEIKSSVKKLKGTYEIELKGDCHVLIAKTVMSKKYKHAVVIDIPIVSVEWIKNSKRKGVFQSFDDFKLRCFEGCKICVENNGLEGRKRKEIKNSCSECGAMFCDDVNDDDGMNTTHLICEKMDDGENGKCYKAVKRGIQIVNYNWYRESKNRGVCLDEDDYRPKEFLQVQANILQMIEKKKNLLRNADTEEEDNDKMDEDDDEEEEDEEEEGGEEKIIKLSDEFMKDEMIPFCLYDCNIYLVGFDKHFDTKLQASKMIRDCGAFQSYFLSPEITHIVVHKPLNEDVQKIKDFGCGQKFHHIEIVGYDWLLDCAQNNQWSDENLYKWGGGVGEKIVKKKKKIEKKVKLPVFENLKFFLKDTHSSIEDHITSKGGKIMESTESSCDYVVYPNGKSVNVKESAKFVNCNWVTDSIEKEEVIKINEKNKYLYKPIYISKLSEKVLNVSTCGIHSSSRAIFKYIVMSFNLEYIGSVTENSNVVVCLSNYRKNSSKGIKKAYKYNKPIVKEEWLLKSAESGVLLDYKKFLHSLNKFVPQVEEEIEEEEIENEVEKEVDTKKSLTSRIQLLLGGNKNKQNQQQSTQLTQYQGTQFNRTEYFGFNPNPKPSGNMIEIGGEFSKKKFTPNQSQVVRLKTVDVRKRKKVFLLQKETENRMKIIKKLGGSIEKKFKENVTHYVVNNYSAKTKSSKFYCALASGIWVLGKKFLEESEKKGIFLDENNFVVDDNTRYTSIKRFLDWNIYLYNLKPRSIATNENDPNMPYTRIFTAGGATISDEYSPNVTHVVTFKYLDHKKDNNGELQKIINDYKNNKIILLNQDFVIEFLESPSNMGKSVLDQNKIKLNYNSQQKSGGGRSKGTKRKSSSFSNNNNKQKKKKRKRNSKRSNSK